MTITVRIPTAADWPAILDVANAALPWDLEGNREWLEYRKQFDETARTRRHYVAEDPTTGQVVGYGALEEGPDFGIFRVFVVMPPERLRSEAGESIYDRLAADLVDLEARGAWAREYTSDTAILEFLQEHDFFEKQQEYAVMRYKFPPGVLILLLALLAGCNLSNRDDTPPIIITATLAPVSPAPTTTPAPTSTAGPPTQATTSPVVPTLPASPFPTFTALPLLPTRPPAPPTRIPFDDGSGDAIPDTSAQGANAATTPVTLPETLYYLSQDQTGLLQVWRLRAGLSYPDQLTLSPTGVTTYAVAPDGTLAYVTPEGNMIIGGLPFLPPASPDGSRPIVTSMAWSPGGDQLAYTLLTPGAAQTTSGPHSVDGVWLRSADGTTRQLAANVYADDTSQRAFTGPLEWRPNGSEVLVGQPFSRIDTATGTDTPLWDSAALPADVYQTAHWTPQGDTIIASGAGSVLRIDPTTLTATRLVGSEYWPGHARQQADGTLVFLSQPPDGPSQLYQILPGQTTPIVVSEAQGATAYLWDNTAGQQALFTIHEPRDAPVGTPFWRDANGTRSDLTFLTGLVGTPQWGPRFKQADAARVQTTAGNPVSLVSELGGINLNQLPNGARVTVRGGPRWFEGQRWWQVQTTDGLLGWVIETALNPA